MEHDQAHELLPWLHAGGLAGDEREALEAHLQGCALCGDELRRLDLLRAAVEEEGAEEPRPSADLLARALARLPAPRARAGFAAGALARLREGWASFWQPLLPPVRLALAAQLVLIAALGIGWYQAARTPGHLVTLSGPAVAPSGEHALLVVAFRPEATEAEVRRSLVSVDGRLAGGPSAAGFYTVAVPLAPDRGKEIEAVLARLRREAAVRYAERAP
jgi:hypothetical protein